MPMPSSLTFAFFMQFFSLAFFVSARFFIGRGHCRTSIFPSRMPEKITVKAYPWEQNIVI
jgi:hypothetical protein